MAAVPWKRIRDGVIRVPEMGDVRPFEAIIDLHPYLHCYADGERLYEGNTFDGAPVLVCRRCSLVVDTRRVA